MKSNKGFAITGILYSALVLFLMLLLLVLSNFHSRRVLFDKQKQNVLEKIDPDLVFVQIEDIFYQNSLYEFIVPQDGIYRLEAWGADMPDGTSKGGYATGEIRLYQGIKLFIDVGASNHSDTSKNGGATSVRTEKNKMTSVILKAAGGNGETGYIYTKESTTDDIELEPLTSSQALKGSVAPEIKSSKCKEEDGCVRISYIKE